jgi:OOP family OmpA-OmpF porin
MDDSSDVPTDERIDVPSHRTGPSERTRDPLVLAIVGLAAAMLLFLAAAIPVLRDRGDDLDSASPGSSTSATTGDAGATTPTSTEVASSTSAPTSGAGGSTTTSTEVASSTPVPAPSSSTTPPAATTPLAAGSPTTTPTGGGTTGGSDEVPESIAVVKGGKIYLSGAVPDQQSMVRIVELAGEVLGPDNVINDYVIDPRASDPNLGNVRVDDHILFESGTARIAPQFEPLLNQALALMTIRPSVTMHVVGHTDDRGSIDDNQDLSERRADAVVRWLTDRGVDPSRLSSEGRGELDPIATNETAAGLALNRRIQVFIANLLSGDLAEDALNGT